MAESSKRFVDQAMKDIAQKGTVLDVGGGQRFTKWMKEYEPLFAKTDYRTLDFDATTGADVVGDIHALPLADASVDGIICASVLEHVHDPKKAMSELSRVLKPGGALFLSVPSTYPYHIREGHYLDYWRFFECTLDELFLTGYSSVKKARRGGYFLALSFFVPGQQRMRPFLTPLAEALDAVFQTHKRNTTAGYYVYAIK